MAPAAGLSITPFQVKWIMADIKSNLLENIKKLTLEPEEKRQLVEVSLQFINRIRFIVPSLLKNMKDGLKCDPNRNFSKELFDQILKEIVDRYETIFDEVNTVNKCVFEIIQKKTIFKTKPKVLETLLKAEIETIQNAFKTLFGLYTTSILPKDAESAGSKLALDKYARSCEFFSTLVEDLKQIESEDERYKRIFLSFPVLSMKIQKEFKILIALVHTQTVQGIFDDVTVNLDEECVDPEVG
ncbi:MAG: hypothetical protein HQK56_08495 [Deltaproteobacteria bacterium]|nr:hypothetical protein [Deltaproteobacteria bacterium]